MKKMKIAIHDNNSSFSVAWINYCIEFGIDFKIINCFGTNIINELVDCDIIMWHHHQNDYRDLLIAKQILFALEHAGKIVYPNFYTGWHFDDKVAQKYLLEAITAPLIPSYVFYNKEDALLWAKTTSYPVVFKLRGGAGATNVKLIKNYNQNKSVIIKSFTCGHSGFNPFVRLKDSVSLFKQNKNSINDVLKSIVRVFIPNRFTKLVNKEKGYVYYQKFLPNNNCDIRVIVIGNKYAYGMKRKVREGDFRASGSNDFIYEKIDVSILESAFCISEKLKLQSVAFDFIYDETGHGKVIEMSYGFGTKGSSKCKGYWDRDLNWHEGEFSPLSWIMEDIISKRTCEIYDN